MNKSDFFVAFLRGINVGGNTMIKMAELKKSFEDLGFENVKTLLASGNVLFQSSQTDSNNLTQKIEEELEKVFGLKITVILRTGDEIRSLVDMDPFKNIVVTPQTRLHVTFIRDTPTHSASSGSLPQAAKSSLTIPYLPAGKAGESSEKDFRILRAVGNNICSVVEVSSTRGTPELMKLLEKEFGKKITTRTWNTVTKIEKILV